MCEQRNKKREYKGRLACVRSLGCARMCSLVAWYVLACRLACARLSPGMRSLARTLLAPRPFLSSRSPSGLGTNPNEYSSEFSMIWCVLNFGMPGRTAISSFRYATLRTKPRISFTSWKFPDKLVARTTIARTLGLTAWRSIAIISSASQPFRPSLSPERAMLASADVGESKPMISQKRPLRSYVIPVMSRSVPMFVRDFHERMDWMEVTLGPSAV